MIWWWCQDRCRSLADERGDAGVIEMLLWFPVAAVLLGTMGVALRQNATAGLAHDAAEAAAHQASIGVNPDDGRALGEASLARSFADQPGTCSGAVDTSGWSAGTVTARKMFGEYGIYCDGKIVALVCDDKLFVKPTAAGKAFAGKVDEVPAYSGAKPSLLVAPDKWDDREWLSGLIRITAAELPAPKKKPARKF